MDPSLLTICQPLSAAAVASLHCGAVMIAVLSRGRKRVEEVVEEEEKKERNPAKDDHRKKRHHACWSVREMQQPQTQKQQQKIDWNQKAQFVKW